MKKIFVELFVAAMVLFALRLGAIQAAIQFPPRRSSAEWLSSDATTSSAQVKPAPRRPG